MTVSIMDGHTGEAHVTSDDWAAFNAATYGSLGAVLGDGLSLSMETSTRGVLSAGLGIVAGRRFRVTEPETIAFDACGAGAKRCDVVVARYAQASDGTESVSVEVVKGEARADKAVRPAVESGDLTLWVVVFAGASVYSCKRGAGATPSIAEAAAEAGAAAEAAKPSTTNLWVAKDSEGNSIDIHATKAGGMVTVCGRSDGLKEVPAENEWCEVATLKEGWRPSRSEFGAGSSFTGQGIAVSVGTDGLVSLVSHGGGPVSYWTFTATFAVE